MFNREVRTLIIILTVNIVFQSLSPAVASAAPDSNRADGLIRKAESLIPSSTQMVDEAIETLAQGWAEMSPKERMLFRQIYDPGETGGINQRFVDDVLANFERIRNRLDRYLTFKYAGDSHLCQQMRLYYVDLAGIHICPYFATEDSDSRKARGLVHEVAHLALLVVDRPYYHDNTYSSRYNALTPRGSWTGRIPVIGIIFREISHCDTLYHPDAYAWFAAGLVKYSQAGHSE